MALVIPNTTTTTSDQVTGAAVFPSLNAGLTPYASGYLFVANNSAQISIAKGPDGSSITWTPYALVQPTLIPISTDRAGRARADYVWGVKAIDGVAGTHAQVFGALYQPGEAGFIPATQFSGTVSPSGGFTPASSGDMNLISEISLATIQSFSGISSSFRHLRLEIVARSTLAAAADALSLAINNDGSNLYLWQFISGAGAAVSGADGAGLTSNSRIGRIPAASAVANQFGTCVVDIPYANSTSVFKAGTAASSSASTNAANGIALETNAFMYESLSAIAALTLQTSAGFAAGSKASLYGIN